MPLNHILRKCIGGSKFTYSQEKKNQPLNIYGQHQSVCKKQKELETNTNKDIQSGYKNGIQNRQMCHANYEKWEKTNNSRNRTARSIKNQNTGRKGNLQLLRNIGSEHHQISRDERKIQQESLKRTRKLFKTKFCSRNLIKGIST